MKSALFLVAVAALCLCAAQAATPTPAGSAPAVVKASSSPTAATTLPTIAAPLADTASSAVSKAATQTSRPATSPMVRAATPRPSATVTIAPRTTALPTTVARTTTEVPGTAVSIPTVETNLTAPSATGLSTTVPLVPVSIDTMYGYVSPSESRTPDIDPGMTPYSGPTAPATEESTPTLEPPVLAANATPTPPEVFFTAEAVGSPTLDLPPGAYGAAAPSPTPTETPGPIVSFEPRETAGSSVLPRWLSYLLFVLVGLAGVAGIALAGSYVGARSPERLAGAADRPAPARRPEVRLLLPGAPEPTIDQQILIDRVAGFEPQSMHVERLARTLLRLERASQAATRDPSVRLGGLLALSAIPSAPVPETARTWARAHGFRVLAVDGSGMALVMPALSPGRHSVLGVLPVGAMIEGASMVPMSVHLTEGGPGHRPRPAFTAGAGVL